MSDGWTYTGAPDECPIHWPTKVGACDCPQPEPRTWGDVAAVQAEVRESWVRAATQYAAEHRCVGCFQVISGDQVGHARGCPTGQNGTPNYE